MKGKTGIETNVIINTRTKGQIASEKRKGNFKNKNASQCMSCENMKDGYCNKYTDWCDIARIECPLCKEKRSDYDANMRFKTKRKKLKKRR